MTTKTNKKSQPVNEAGIVVGDILVSSWGYDQTNIDYYKVIAVTAKGVRMQAWKSANGGPCEGTYDYVIPGDGPKTSQRCTLTGEAFYASDYWTRQEHMVTEEAPIKFHRVRGTDRKSAYISLTSYSGAHLWSGTPQTQTAIGFGH
jgi:hypothetical protein